MSQVWDWSVKRYNNKSLMGTREVLGEEDEVQPNGKMFTKLDLGDYRWLSYDEADSMAERFGRGLRALGEQTVVHGLNETGAELVITSHELLPKFRSILA